jgi:quercetin dioxygenase-like cupin family protein
MMPPGRHEWIARRIDPRESAVIDVLGPTIQLLTFPDEGRGVPCIMRGTIPSGVVIPLHSHPDPETFLMLSGEVEGCSQTEVGFRWIRLGVGDVFHVPAVAKHAFRNHWPRPAVMIAITTARLGGFFLEVGTPIPSGSRPPDAPSREALRRFMETAARYGHWIATPEENMRVGIDLPEAQ